MLDFQTALFIATLHDAMLCYLHTVLIYSVFFIALRILEMSERTIEKGLSAEYVPKQSKIIDSDDVRE